MARNREVDNFQFRPGSVAGEPLAELRRPLRVTKRATLSLERHKGVAGPSLTGRAGLLNVCPPT